MASLVQSAAGIDWYCERAGAGAPVVLVPSGEGDCGSFARVAEILAGNFDVLTFDMPGFSRTSRPAGFDKVTIAETTDQIADLLRSFELGPAVVYGCSSGGQVVLDLAARHPDLVLGVIAHEVPLSYHEGLAALAALDDESISNICMDIFRNEMNENAEAWDALGSAYHARLQANYVTWIRHYVHEGFLQHFSAKDLRSRPLVWTVGGLSTMAAWHDNVVAAASAGVEAGLLMCRHFPQVSIPEVLAAHIAAHAMKWRDEV